MIKRQARAYEQKKKQLIRLTAIIKKAISNPKREDMTWRAYFWGDCEEERYWLPIK